MPLASCTVSGVVQLPDASIPVYSGKLVFTLSNVETDTETVVPIKVESSLNASTGAFSVDLWPNARGTTESAYYVKLERTGAVALRQADPIDLGTIYVPDNATADFDDLVQTPPFVPPSASVLLLAEAAKDEAVASAATATTGAATATTKAAEASASATSAAASSAAAGAASGRLDIGAFAELATKFVYSSPGAGQELVSDGDVVLWRERGVVYKVIASGASDADFDYTGSSGVKIRVEPDSNGVLQFGAFDPPTDGTTDVTAKWTTFRAALERVYTDHLVADLGAGPYYWPDTIQFTAGLAITKHLTLICNRTKIVSGAASGSAGIEWGMRTTTIGELILDMQGTAGTDGFQWGMETGGVVGPCQYCSFDVLRVVNGHNVARLYSDYNSGVYYNHCNALFAEDFNGEGLVYHTRQYDDVTVTGITQANPAVVTATAHGLTTGQKTTLRSVVGMTEVNDLNFTVTVSDVDTYSLDGIDSTAYTAYTSGGTSERLPAIGKVNTNHFGLVSLVDGEGDLLRLMSAQNNSIAHLAVEDSANGYCLNIVRARGFNVSGGAIENQSVSANTLRMADGPEVAGINLDVQVDALVAPAFDADRSITIRGRDQSIYYGAHSIEQLEVGYQSNMLNAGKFKGGIEVNEHATSGIAYVKLKSTDWVIRSNSNVPILTLDHDGADVTIGGDLQTEASGIAITYDGFPVLQSFTSTEIAENTDAPNAGTGKRTGAMIYDSTNNRVMVASGGAATSAWYVVDGSASVTPS